LKSKYISDVQPFPTNFVYPLQTATFLDEPASVPNQVEPYLSHMYHYLGQDAVMDKQTGYWYKKEDGGG
jgi:hypothetical protein